MNLPSCYAGVNDLLLLDCELKLMTMWLVTLSPDGRNRNIGVKSCVTSDETLNFAKLLPFHSPQFIQYAHMPP